MSQRPEEKKQEPKAEKFDTRAEWPILLVELLLESRRVDNEHDRAVLIAEVANGYWTFDKKLSKDLFTESMDLALSLKPSKESKRPRVSEILALAARRDIPFAKTLVQRAYQKSENENESNMRSLEIAGELFESSPQAAVELAMAGASGGSSMNGMWFLFKLAEKHRTESQQVYERYLRSLSSRQLSRVLWLAGYPLGFAEAYGDANDPASLVGFGGLRISDFAPQPQFASAYLAVAYDSISQTLTQAVTAPIDEKEKLNSLALFAIEYLHEGVQLYRPDLHGHWAALHQRALSVVSPAGRVASQSRLKVIVEVRARVNEYKSSQEYATGEAQKEVERIERIAGGCQREVAYSKLALAHSFVKDFNTARQVIEKIETLKMRDAVLQFVTFDQTTSAIEAGDLTEALRLSEKISANDHRANLYLRIAMAAVKRADKSMAIDALSRARSLADSAEPLVQAGILITAASVFSEFDSVEATNILSRAIRSLNTVKGQLPITFTIERRVPIACDGSDGQWYGNNERSGTRNLYEVFAFLAKSKITVNEALMLARAIEDRSTRIRAQLSVINGVAPE